MTSRFLCAACPLRFLTIRSVENRYRMHGYPNDFATSTKNGLTLGCKLIYVNSAASGMNEVAESDFAAKSRHA